MAGDFCVGVIRRRKSMSCYHSQEMFVSRRAFLGQSAGSLGAMALAHLFANQSRAAPAVNASAKAKAKAKSVICLFQHGGPSQMDLFDPKPVLAKHDGKPYPGGDLETHFDKQKGNCLSS